MSNKNDIDWEAIGDFLLPQRGTNPRVDYEKNFQNTQQLRGLGPDEYYLYVPLHDEPLDNYRNLALKDARREYQRVEDIKPYRLMKIKEILSLNGIRYDFATHDLEELNKFIEANLYSCIGWSKEKDAEYVPDPLWLSLLFDIGLLAEEYYLSNHPELRTDVNTWVGPKFDTYRARVIVGFKNESYKNECIDLTADFQSWFGILRLSLGRPVDISGFLKKKLERIL